VASLMGLPRPVKDEAGFICKKALEKGLVRGRSIEAIVAAAVYAACRIDGVPRTLDELQQVTGVRKKTIGKAYGALLRTLTLRVRAVRFRGNENGKKGLIRCVCVPFLWPSRRAEFSNVDPSLSGVGNCQSAKKAFAFRLSGGGRDGGDAGQRSLLTDPRTGSTRRGLFVTRLRPSL